MHRSGTELGEFRCSLSAPDSSSDAIKWLCAKLRKHKLVTLRGQFLTDDQHVEFAAKFGPLERHRPADGQVAGRPEIFRVAWEPGEGHTNVGLYWHQDGCTRQPPTEMATYRLPISPACGGDTLFIDAAEVLSRASETLLHDLRRLKWTHKCGTRQPFVRIHPRTGAEVLSVNLGKVANVRGLPPTKVRQFLRQIETLLDGANIYAHQWKPGDLVIADNLSILHRATARVAGMRRVLHRVSILSLACDD